jgi:hypothetical protein
MATLVQPTGLLIQMLTDGEWDAYGANRSVTPNGTLTIAQRPPEPTHDPILNGMTNAQISVAKYNNDRHKIWHEATADLKQSIIASLGPTLAGTIGPPPDGFKMITLGNIVTAVRTKYGVVDQIALNKMEEIITTPLDTVANYDKHKHLARLRQYILMQTAAGYPIEEYRKARIFRKTVEGHHLIAQCLADYDRLNPDPLVHTFASITAYVATHLLNVRAAADIASPAGPSVRRHDGIRSRDWGASKRHTAHESC